MVFFDELICYAEGNTHTGSKGQRMYCSFQKNA